MLYHISTVCAVSGLVNEANMGAVGWDGFGLLGLVWVRLVGLDGVGVIGWLVLVSWLVRLVWFGFWV